MIVWKVEDGQLVKYERFGECKTCGQCCLEANLWHGAVTVGVYQSKEVNEIETDEDWSEWKGRMIFLHHGIWWYFKVWKETDDEPAPCPSLEGKLCLHFRHEYHWPPLCRYWPMDVDQLYQGCGFSFERIGE